MGQYLLTSVSNLINRQNLTDAHTCYKMVRADIFKSIPLKEKGFAFCPELNTKLSNIGIKLLKYQLIIMEELMMRKKISAVDGLIAIKTLFKYKYFS